VVGDRRGRGPQGGRRVLIQIGRGDRPVWCGCLLFWGLFFVFCLSFWLCCFACWLCCFVCVVCVVLCCVCVCVCVCVIY
jgi:hypothetical protein